MGVAWEGVESVSEVECKSGGLVAWVGAGCVRVRSRGFSGFGRETGMGFGSSLFLLCSGVDWEG